MHGYLRIRPVNSVLLQACRTQNQIYATRCNKNHINRKQLTTEI